MKCPACGRTDRQVSFGPAAQRDETGYRCVYCGRLYSFPSEPKYITAPMLAELGNVSIQTVSRLIERRTVEPAKTTELGIQLFDPEAPDVVLWLKSRGRWPVD